MKPKFPTYRTSGKAPVRGKSVRKLDEDSAEDLPGYETIRPRDYRDGQRDKGWHTIKRFLQSRVGQPWKDVWSEVCRLKDDHIKEIAADLVEIHTYTDADGDVVYIERFIGGETKIKASPLQLYVDPTTFQLAITPAFKRGRTAAPKVPWRLIEGSYYLNVTGIWYEATRQEPTIWDDRDNWYRYNDIETLEQGTRRWVVQDRKDKYVLARGNQLGKKDLKRLGLSNWFVPLVPKHIAFRHNWHGRVSPFSS